jgi:hypothetical protein
MTSRSGWTPSCVSCASAPLRSTPVPVRERPPPTPRVPLRHRLRFRRALARRPYDTAAPRRGHDAAARAHRLGARRRRADDGRRVPARSRSSTASCSGAGALQRDAPGGSASHRSRVGCLLIQPAPAARSDARGDRGRHARVDPSTAVPHRAGGGNFCDLAPTPTFRSPWSGARLPLHSLVHASFVWFGLLACGASWRASRPPPTRRRTRARSHRPLPVRIRVPRRPARQRRVPVGERRPARARRAHACGGARPRDTRGEPQATLRQLAARARRATRWHRPTTGAAGLRFRELEPCGFEPACTAAAAAAACDPADGQQAGHEHGVGLGLRHRGDADLHAVDRVEQARREARRRARRPSASRSGRCSCARRSA